MDFILEDSRLQRHSGLQPRRTALGYLLAFGPLVIFALFFVNALVLHGEALSGKIVDGHYFVNAKGQFTQVSRGAFYLSLWLGRAMIASFVVAAAFAICVEGWSRSGAAWTWVRRTLGGGQPTKE